MVITTHVKNVYHHIVYMLPVVVPLSTATTCPSWFPIPMAASFLASTNLVVYSWDTLSTSCNSMERNLMGISWVIKQANPLLRIFQSIYLYNFHSKILLPLCQNLEVPCHVVDTFILVWKQACPLNMEVIHCPEMSVTQSC